MLLNRSLEINLILPDGCFSLVWFVQTYHQRIIPTLLWECKLMHLIRRVQLSRVNSGGGTIITDHHIFVH